MAKISSSTLALFAALMLVAHAVAFRTTITTVETDDVENYSRSGSEQECRRQRQDLNHCRMYMREKMHGRFEEEDEIGNYSQHLDQCCSQLRNVNERCRCPALEMEIQKEQGQDKQRMMESARNIPSMCGMQPRTCQFHSRYY
ncbi:2S seed storage albumin protein-like [Cannabis sativa]|uniref:2S seed storage albumin protein-like n=1 Tax=Cannabis sativa TaxID=3483 RepID=UPI0029CA7351|nr:2S seed storage albumin protein-like [Cannabis sativa]